MLLPSALFCLQLLLSQNVRQTVKTIIQTHTQTHRGCIRENGNGNIKGKIHNKIYKQNKRNYEYTLTFYNCFIIFCIQVFELLHLLCHLTHDRLTYVYKKTQYLFLSHSLTYSYVTTNEMFPLACQFPFFGSLCSFLSFPLLWTV